MANILGLQVNETSQKLLKIFKNGFAMQGFGSNGNKIPPLKLV